MEQVTFSLGGDMLVVEVDGNNAVFMDGASGMLTSIEGLRINRAGVLKEFPDLEHDDEWRKKAIDRLKLHISRIESEHGRIDYIISELVKHGYRPLFRQKNGWRPVKVNNPIDELEAINGQPRVP